MAGTYTYEQIHQLTTQAGYQGAQADSIAMQLYNSQTAPSTTPPLDLSSGLNQLGMRGMKILLGMVLLGVGLFAIFLPDITALGEKAAPPLRAVGAAEQIRSARATRKLRQVETARATHELQRARATGSQGPQGAPPQRTPQGGTLGEQPGNEPTTGGRPVKPTATPKVKQPRTAEEVARARMYRERRLRTPNVAAAEETWRAVASPAEIAAEQAREVRRNNRRSAGERETPIESLPQQRRAVQRRRAPLPGGTVQPARKRPQTQNERDNAARLRAQRKLRGNQS